MTRKSKPKNCEFIGRSEFNMASLNFYPGEKGHSHQ